MSKAIQGVNLGGWLVLEKWLTPGLFAGSEAEDEYGLMLELGSRAHDVLAVHRDSFVTEEDFVWIKGRGLEAVRLPVGYWVFDSYEPYVECLAYIDRAFEWAERYDLLVLVDLHAAPGSQNGWDHSGRKGDVRWHKNKANIELSLWVLKQLAERYGSRKSLLGIEALNEPRWDVPMRTLFDYYERAYDVLEANLHDNAYIVFHDGFRPHEMASRLAGKGFRNTVLDMHMYQVFSDEYIGMSLEEHIEHAAHQWSEQLATVSKSLPVIIGEWSASLGDDAFPASIASEQKRAGHLRYAKAQKKVFDMTLGYFYWNYKAVDAGTWSLRDYPEYAQR